MRKHNGMRPQDVVVLLKILTISRPQWQFKDLAYELALSGAEVSESLNRSHLAGLVDETKKKVYRDSLLEFLIHGLHYVFPQAPGAMVNGIATAHSHPYFRKSFKAEFKYVWPHAEANERGLSIEPLYPGVIKAIEQDEKLYKLLAITDILRVGRQRELEFAKKELRKMVAHNE